MQTATSFSQTSVTIIHVCTANSSLKHSSSSLSLSQVINQLSPTTSSMADQRQHQQQQLYHPTEAIKGMLPEKAPSKSQVLVLVTLLPVGGTLLLLSGLSLAGTLIGLAITTPLFVIFSPVLVPAALVIALAMAGFLTSGACGITALSSLSYMANFLRRMRVPEQTEQVKRRALEMVSQKPKEVGQRVQNKAQETKEAKEKEKGEGKHELEAVGSTQGLEAHWAESVTDFRMFIFKVE